MTTEMKFLELLKELSQVIKDKNDLISLKNYQIEDLRKQLQEKKEKQVKFLGQTQLGEY